MPKPAGDEALIARFLASKRGEVRIWKHAERAFSNRNAKAGFRRIKQRVRVRNHSRKIVAGYGFQVCA
jgi:hypothetical protein